MRTAILGKIRVTITSNVNLYHATTFPRKLSFITVNYLYAKISSFPSFLSRRIVLHLFYLLIFYFENFSTLHLTFAVNLTLKFHYYKQRQHSRTPISLKTSVVLNRRLRDWFITRKRAFGSRSLQTAQICVNKATYVTPCAHAYGTGRSDPADLRFLFVCSHLAILKSGHIWSKIKLNTPRGTREGDGSY